VRALRVVDRVATVEKADLTVTRGDVEVLPGVEFEIARRMSSDGDHVLVERFAVPGSRPAKNAKLDRHSAPRSQRGKAQAAAKLQERVPQPAENQHEEERDSDEAPSATTRGRDFYRGGFGDYCRRLGRRLFRLGRGRRSPRTALDGKGPRRRITVQDALDRYRR